MTELIDIAAFGGFDDVEVSAPGSPANRTSPASIARVPSLDEDHPFGANGILARVGERLPFISSAVQQIHAASGDEAALRRAQGEDPMGRDGILTQAAEHIPFLNYLIQEAFRHAGDDRALQRARERDPIGTDGYITKVFEHIPGVSDVVMAWHRHQGENSAAERARARTFQHLLSKDGAITRLAELMPVSNLIAAAMHEFNGNREEAIRALNLLDSWSNAFHPDSPFARVAELLPGTDVLAFALHVQGGHYAQAMRSLTKTSWVVIAADSVCLKVQSGSLPNLLCVAVDGDGVAIRPCQLSLLVGLRDVLTNFLIVDTQGHRRVFRAEIDLDRLGQGRKAWEVTKELLESMVNEKITGQVCNFTNDVPRHVEWLVQALNRRMPRWRTEYPAMRALFPRAPLPPAPRRWVDELQQATPRASISRGRFPPAPRPVQRRKQRCKSLLLAETVSAAGCITAAGGCGLVGAKAGAVCCTAGLICGAVELGRAAVRRMASWLDAWNAESWENVTTLPQPPSPGAAAGGPGAAVAAGPRPRDEPAARSASRSRGAAEARKALNTSCGVVVEFAAEDAARLGRLSRGHYLSGIWRKSLRARCFRALEPVLLALARTVLEIEDTMVPFVLEVELDPWEIELEGYSFDLQMPSMRFALVIHLDLRRGVPRTKSVFAVLPDELYGNILRKLEAQIPEWDLRELDPRFAGFREPAHLNLQLDMTWPRPDEFRLEAQKMSVRLDIAD